jgi:hypothetical protein
VPNTSQAATIKNNQSENKKQKSTLLGAFLFG